MLRDSKAEATYSFSLRQTLESARKQAILSGYSLFLTPHIKPPPHDLAQIIECSGGWVRDRVGRKLERHWVVQDTHSHTHTHTHLCSKGGTVLASMPSAAKDKTFVISCPEDESLLAAIECPVRFQDCCAKHTHIHTHTYTHTHTHTHTYTHTHTHTHSHSHIHTHGLGVHTGIHSVRDSSAKT